MHGRRKPLDPYAPSAQNVICSEGYEKNFEKEIHAINRRRDECRHEEKRGILLDNRWVASYNKW